MSTYQVNRNLSGDFSSKVKKTLRDVARQPNMPVATGPPNGCRHRQDKTRLLLKLLRPGVDLACLFLTRLDNGLQSSTDARV